MADGLLTGYWRSSASYRVRIALNLKGLSADHRAVDLRSGAQNGPQHLTCNPAGLVPVWQEPGGFTLAQSLAIIEYLEERYPDPPLLPQDRADRALAREIALTIACDIHPIGNLRVLEKLSRDYGADADGRAAWNRHWISQGLAAVEARLARTAGTYAVGDLPTIADICIVPQLYNARRFQLDLSPFPKILAAEAAALALPGFCSAAPELQPDAD